MRYLILFLSFLTTVVVAQESKPKKFYMEIMGGYGFPLVNDDLGSTNDLIGKVNRLIRADSSISILPVQGTQGPGGYVSLNAGYMFHPNIGFEIGAYYLRSTRFLLAKNITPTFQAEHTIIGERLDLIPQLVLNINFAEKWSLYSKSGLVIPVWGRSSSEIKIDDQEGRLVYEYTGLTNPNTHGRVRIKASTYGKFSYGFQTRLGVGYKALDWLSVFGEVKFVALSIRSKEDRFDDVEISLFDANTGEGITLTEDDLDVIDKSTVFVDELTENSNNPTVNTNPDPNRPMEELARKDNFNQLGISIGLRFYIR
ncbi:MAG: outer membrane beta-barrel protein [Flavobacteriales bacterium]|nr:outer membrane beta-barrel protein [Flavobacteriales bacterium]